MASPEKDAALEEEWVARPRTGRGAMWEEKRRGLTEASSVFKMFVPPAPASSASSSSLASGLVAPLASGVESLENVKLGNSNSSHNSNSNSNLNLNNNSSSDNKKVPMDPSERANLIRAPYEEVADQRETFKRLQEHKRAAMAAVITSGTKLSEVAGVTCGEPVGPPTTSRLLPAFAPLPKAPVVFQNPTTSTGPRTSLLSNPGLRHLRSFSAMPSMPARKHERVSSESASTFGPSFGPTSAPSTGPTSVPFIGPTPGPSASSSGNTNNSPCLIINGINITRAIFNSRHDPPIGDQRAAFETLQSNIAAATANSKPYSTFPTLVSTTGLRENLLMHGRMPYGNQVMTELRSLTFHDCTPSMMNDVHSNVLLRHYEGAGFNVEDQRRVVLYEVNVPNKEQPANQNPSNPVTTRWIWCLISQPLITFEDTSSNPESSEIQSAQGSPTVPMNWVVFASPLTSIGRLHEVHGSRAYTQENVKLVSTKKENISARDSDLSIDREEIPQGANKIIRLKSTANRVLSFGTHNRKPSGDGSASQARSGKFFKGDEPIPNSHSQSICYTPAWGAAQARSVEKNQTREIEVTRLDYEFSRYQSPLFEFADKESWLGLTTQSKRGTSIPNIQADGGSFTDRDDVFGGPLVAEYSNAKKMEMGKIQTDDGSPTLKNKGVNSNLENEATKLLKKAVLKGDVAEITNFLSAKNIQSYSSWEELSKAPGKTTNVRPYRYAKDTDSLSDSDSENQHPGRFSMAPFRQAGRKDQLLADLRNGFLADKEIWIKILTCMNKGGCRIVARVEPRSKKSAGKRSLGRAFGKTFGLGIRGAESEDEGDGEQ